MCRRVSAVIIILALLMGFTASAGEMAPIVLSSPDLNRGTGLMNALDERKTSREFSEKELPIDVLSGLLWAACGINRPDSGKRTAPSAMNMQEIDIYVAMKSGLYLYDAPKNLLQPVIPDDIRGYVGKQEFTAKAPVGLIYVADFSRMRGSESDNIFYSAVDTGYISQNVYLFCASEGLSTVVLGWVDKPALAGKMGLREDQRIILSQPVGYPLEKR